MSKQEVWERDGKECFYCGVPLTIEAATHEHLLAKASNGTSSNANCTVACHPCNAEAGSLPIVDKVKLRDLKRGYLEIAKVNRQEKLTTLTIGDIKIEIKE